MKRILKGLLASIFLMCITVLPVSAAENAPEPRIMCSECFAGNLVHVCAEDEIYSGTGDHLFGSCTYDMYSSHSYYVCSNSACDFYEEVPNTHYCLEVHSSCGRGEYRICPCGYFPS